MSVLFAATHPDRTQRLVLYAAPRYRTSTRRQPGRQRWSRVPAPARCGRALGRGRTLGAVAPSADSERDRIGRGDPPALGRQPADGAARCSAWHRDRRRDVLPSVRVPTLVLHRTSEFKPVEHGALPRPSRFPARGWSNFPGQTTFPYGDAEVVDEIEEFLTGARHAPTTRSGPHDGAVHGHRRLDGTAAALGDARWRELLERHDDHARGARALPGPRGQDDRRRLPRDLRRTGARIRCARAIAIGCGHSGIEVRAGLHTGECELVGDDIGGMAVNIGARVGALAVPSEVLVSSTVKDLVVGSGSRSSDRGAQRAQGRPRRMAPLRRGQSGDAGQQQARA